ncbi:MAG TPA: hypothetical protein G4O15_08120 [Dehalococcoidia bacterium]|nr:hypothetical protein [Dehalococcoidia bacterium]
MEGHEILALAVYSDPGFEEFSGGEMVLKTIHTACGITLDKAKDKIRWDIKIANDLSDTEPPTNEELRVYREKIVVERRVIRFSRRTKEENTRDSK